MKKILVILTVSLMLGGCGVNLSQYNNVKSIPPDLSKKTEEELIKEKAISLAKEEYDRQKNEKVDFSKGPCLTNNLMDDWVADIAHTPREIIDNNSENQCKAYRNGEAHHFVELDPQGVLIRAE